MVRVVYALHCSTFVSKVINSNVNHFYFSATILTPQEWAEAGVMIKSLESVHVAGKFFKKRISTLVRVEQTLTFTELKLLSLNLLYYTIVIIVDKSCYESIYF